ncbi:hypothetical protein MIB43_000040 [Providencia rettgeri]|uniref:hypothetical protein n=1 Tax=Providencia rettgeri TaxID=587 RepID=UPI001F047F89|nr:hypothetical protein [Providencia rettgeri]MCG9948314.1 hypothetical protein [Providencia rettgeri]
MNSHELLELTPSQKHALDNLELAIREFKQLGGLFYNHLDSVMAFNGQYIAEITVRGMTDETTSISELNTHHILRDECGGIDGDEHIVIFTADGKRYKQNTIHR